MCWWNLRSEVGSYTSTKKKGGDEEVKYLIMGELREPIEENLEKMYAVERERIEKGEVWGEEMVFQHHVFLSEFKSFFVVQTEDESKIAK